MTLIQTVESLANLIVAGSKYKKNVWHAVTFSDVNFQNNNYQFITYFCSIRKIDKIAKQLNNFRLLSVIRLMTIPAV